MFSRGKLWLVKQFLDPRQRIANLYWVSMRVNSILMLSVNQCPLDSILVWYSMVINIVSNKDPTKHDLWRLCLLAFFQISRPESKIVKLYTTGTQRKNNCFGVDRFCDHSSTVFEALGCFCSFCECQELQYELTEEEFVKGHGRKGIDELRQFI